MGKISVESKCYPLRELFSEKFDVDFYQREYVWQRKQLEDLIDDLSAEFLKNWTKGDTLDSVRTYDPYFMGEIVLSIKSDNSRNVIIDGQQRITTFTLLLIWLLKNYKNVPGFPVSDIANAIYSDDYGTPRFNLDIDIRKDCMLGLFQNGKYDPTPKDEQFVQNIVDRYNDISECWNSNIDTNNIVNFVYWLKEKIIFSKVYTNSDEFAYVIFETMNDRGISLTQVEMLRSYLLAKIDTKERKEAIDIFDKVWKRLMSIKPTSKSKAEFEFFKMFLRGHYASDFNQTKNSNSDFVRIGKEFHRWVRDNENTIGIVSSVTCLEFVKQIDYFSAQYEKIYNLINARDTSKYLYLIVNSDYGFTLQPALILSAIKYKDSDKVVEEKIKLISKYLTKVLSWRVWNHLVISQSSMEASIYELCKQLRDKDIDDIIKVLQTDPIDLPQLKNSPTLNQQNKPKIKVLLSLITEIVAVESKSPNYMLNQSSIEVEHIWSDHFSEHMSEFADESSFATMRNNIGDLLVLPKAFNASYGDDDYQTKVVQYYQQNILAQTLNENKYKNNPDFIRFVNNSKLPFKSYKSFDTSSITERADLYKKILLWNWR